jgi:WD40 repeat protein
LARRDQIEGPNLKEPGAGARRNVDHRALPRAHRYACGLGVSPDGAYVITGDGEGHLVIYDWKSTKRFAKIRAHDQVCMDVLWHPYETSKVITCGWDGLVKLWD